MSNEFESNEMEDQDAQHTNTENSELAALRVQATELGLRYHHNAGIPRLKQLIKTHLQEQQGAVSEPITEEALMNTPSVQKPKRYGFAPATREEIIQRRKKEASKLIRIRVTCMNPNKKNWPGEIFSVGSSKIGTFKKYVPFNVADGWHVPNIIYEMIKDRRCLTFYETVDHKGRKIKKTHLIPEFAVEVMPPLTKQELKDLADRQAKSFAIDN